MVSDSHPTLSEIVCPTLPLCITVTSVRPALDFEISLRTYSYFKGHFTDFPSTDLIGLSPGNVPFITMLMRSSGILFCLNNTSANVTS